MKEEKHIDFIITVLIILSALNVFLSIINFLA